MKVLVNHPTYGEIVYEESPWTGKRTITVNGVAAKAISKKEFSLNGKNAQIKGNLFTGMALCINGECIELTVKPKWYEVVLTIIPMVFFLTWGNVPSLCAVFPVVGGALGGALGALSGFTSFFLMKRGQTPIIKVLIGLGVFAASLLVGFLLAILFVLVLI